MLTWVRDGDPARDERHHPERTAESIGVTDREAAQTIFASFCALPAVRAGKQRAKVVDLAGKDQWHAPTWVAPLVTDATRRALIRLGARRPRSWS
jgi:hypothetical protein